MRKIVRIIGSTIFSVAIGLAQVEQIRLEAKDAVLLDTVSTIFGGFSDAASYTVSVKGVVTGAPISGVFIMMYDNNSHKFTFVKSGQQIQFKPGFGEYKFCAFICDWSDLTDNAGYYIVEISDGRKDTIFAKDAIFLDDVTFVKHNLLSSSTYRVSVVDSTFGAMPMKGVFVMYKDNLNVHHFQFLQSGQYLDFKPSESMYQFSAFQVDWSNGNDNEGTTTINFAKITSALSELRSENQFEIFQNYPNPFNPSTTISFIIPNTMFTTVEIYNSIGQKMESIVSKILSAGYHQIVWNGSNVPSGQYFYRIKSGDFSETKIMHLVK